MGQWGRGLDAENDEGNKWNWKEELQRVLARLPNKKAVGMDQISYEIFKKCLEPAKSASV